MNVSIHSRDSIEKLISNSFPPNTAVISFNDPLYENINSNAPLIDFKGKSERIFRLSLPDIDIDSLDEYGYNINTYFTESDKLAKFIIDSYNDGLDIICQCEYGESRSSGCAAAILEYYYHNGISIFSDYDFYPNKLIFNKLLLSLKNQTLYKQSN